MKTPILQIITSEDEIKLIITDAVKHAITEITRGVITTEAQLEILTGEELKERLKVSETTLKKYRVQGRIPYILIGGQYRYNFKDVVEALTIKKR